MWRLTCHQFLEYSSCGSRSSFVLIFIKKIEFDKVNLAENCLSKLILIKSAFQTLIKLKKKNYRMISIECVKCQVRDQIFKKFKTSILVMNCVNPQISGLLFGMTFVDAALSRVQPLPWLRSPMKPMSIGSDDHRSKVQSLEKKKVEMPATVIRTIRVTSK